MHFNRLFQYAIAWACIILVCLGNPASGQTYLTVGSCTDKWSSWKDLDNPSGNADNELLRYMHELWPEHMKKDLCQNPSAVEARIIGTTLLATNENVEISLGGLLCRNSDQPKGHKCSDYEVRFCCKTTTATTDLTIGTCTGKWSSWKDLDNPSGNADNEQLQWMQYLFPSSEKRDLCSYPLAVEARIIGTTILATNENVEFSLGGLLCRNSDQPKGGCSDYEVRFCCKTTTTLTVGSCNGRWSSWKDLDNPSGNADNELLRYMHQLFPEYMKTDLCKNPSAVEGRIKGTKVLSTDENVEFSLGGLLCRNSDQSKGGCSDYEVRFCC